MPVKDVIEKIGNAESVQISLSEEDWNSLGSNASVVKLEGTPEEVNGRTLAFIKSGDLSVAKTLAIVLFCNPGDPFSMLGAIPGEEISAIGSKILYGVCCEKRPLGTVEVYITYN